MADPDASGELLSAMREAFARNDFQQTLAAFQRLSDMGRMRRSLRVETTCLAARAHIARQERPAARALLRPLLDVTYTKVVHYDFLAHAFLDLRNYREAARMCHRAGELHEAEKKN